MQLLPPSSGSSTSSSSHSSGEFDQRLHLYSPSAPPPPHPKGRKHRHHCPPPPHHRHRQHHHDHSVNKHGHSGQLRVKPPKPSKKVHKLHHKLMKVPKGGGNHPHYHLPLGADALFKHPPGCCLHYSIEDEGRAEERRPPHEVAVGHHAHLRPMHPHRRHPCVKPQIKRGAVAPSHYQEAAATPPSHAMLSAYEAPMC